MNHEWIYVTHTGSDEQPRVSIYHCQYCGKSLNIPSGEDITPNALPGCTGIICPLMSAGNIAIPDQHPADMFVGCKEEHCGFYNTRKHRCNQGKNRGQV